MWKYGVDLSNSIDFAQVLSAIKSNPLYLMPEGPVSVANHNAINRKIFFAKHSNGKFEITYMSPEIFLAKAFRVMDYDGINYECKINADMTISKFVVDSIKINVMLPLQGSNRRSGLEYAMGILAAIIEINAKKILPYFLIPVFYNEVSNNLYLTSLYEIISKSKDLIFIGGMNSNVRDDLSPALISSKALFFYPGITVDKKCHGNIISTGMILNEVLENALNVIQMFTSTVIIIKSENNDPEMVSNLESILTNNGIIIKEVIDFSEGVEWETKNGKFSEGIMVSLLEEENEDLFIELFDIINPVYFKLFILFPVLEIFDLDPIYTHNHLVASTFFHKLKDDLIEPELDDFNTLTYGNLFTNMVSWKTESSYIAIQLLANALYLSNDTNPLTIIKSLEKTSVKGPSGLITITNGLVNRRMISCIFDNGELSVISYPKIRYFSNIFPLYLDSSKIHCEINDQSLGRVKKYILMIHEYENGEILKYESSAASVANYIISITSNDPKLKYIYLQIKHLFINTENIEDSLGLYENPVFIFGCYHYSCMNQVVNHYENKGIIFFYHGMDYSIDCNPDLFFIQTNIEERYDLPLGYINKYTSNIFIVYSKTEKYLYKKSKKTFFMYNEIL